MRIVRRDLGQGAGLAEQELSQSSQPSIEPDVLLLDRLIYRKIGSLTDNKLLVTPDSADTDFHRWLLDMNNLHNKKYYPLLSEDLPLPTPDLVALDEYLGSLGVTEDYPFLDDTYNVLAWLKIDYEPDGRILIDITDNTYLTDSNGTEILVVDNRRI